MAAEGGTPDHDAAPDAEGSDHDIDRDDVFDVLSNPRRRYALHLVRDEDEVELGEVAEQVAAWENDTSVESVGSDQRKHAYTALQQRHLPRMDELDVVEFDRRAGTVSPAEGLDEFDIYLEVVEGRDVPWSEYYLGLGAVATAVVAATHVGVPGVDAVTGLGWATFVAVALLVSAGVHYAVTRGNRLGASAVPPEVEREEG
jgi:hypothetical protein